MEPHLRALMLNALDGDGRAYASLLETLRTHLVRYYSVRLGSGLAANRDDLVQETLLAIHTRRQTYDRDQPLTAWVYAIARYKLIDHFRRNRVRATVPIDDEIGLFARDESDDAAARMDIDTVLSTLDKRPAELIREVRVHGATIAEAAKRAGMSETAAKVSIHRGIKALAARFAGGRSDE
jgi:RNA polymerase sigma factor (sigma-70 family)